MSNGYAINGINYYDPTALMNDSAFLQAFQSMNVNSPAFKAAQQMYQPQVGSELLPTPTENTAQPPAFKAQPTKEGHGLLVGGVLTTAAAVGAIAYAAKKGNGEGIIQGFKNIWKGLKGTNPTRAMKKFVFDAKDGSRIVVDEGKIASITTRGKDSVIKDNAKITTELAKNKLNPPKDFKSGKKIADNVTIDRYIIKQGNYKFEINNGKIIKVTDTTPGAKKIKDVDKFMETFSDKSALEGRIADIKSGTYKNCDKLENVSYTWTDPKTGITLFKSADKTKQTLTIPGKLCKSPLTETEQKAWLNKNSDIDKQIQELIAKGRSEGVKIDLNNFTDANGNRLLINADGKITEIILKDKPKTGPQNMKKGSTDFDAWLYDHKDVKEAIEREVKSGLAGNDSRFVAA